MVIALETQWRRDLIPGTTSLSVQLAPESQLASDLMNGQFRLSQGDGTTHVPER